MPNLAEIGWVAGIVEGEGCIVVSPKSSTLRLSVEMTDLDVLQKLARILGSDSRLTERKIKLANPNHKTRYILHLCGRSLLGWLQTIYPLMGTRRKTKIIEALLAFKHRKRKLFVQRHRKLSLAGI